MKNTDIKVSLKSARKNKHLTQKQVADAAGISRTAYTNIELGTARPSVETAKAIAKVIDIEWTEFFK